jgi:O-antigen/teichoic acid export membrane protein
LNILGKSISALFYKVISTGISFIIGIIIARTLMPDGRGIYAFTTSTAVLIGTLGALGMGNASVYLINNKGYDLKKTYNTLFWFSIAVSILLILITKFTYFFIPRLFNNLNNSYVNEICLLILLNMVNTFINPILLTKLNIRKMNIINVSTTILQLILLVFGWGLKIITIRYCVIIYIITLLANVFLIVILERALYLFRFSIDLDILKSTFIYGMKIYAGNVAFLLHLSFDTYLINYFCTSYEVGIYSVSVSIAQLMFLIPNTIGPLIYSYWSKSNDLEINSIFRALRSFLYVIFIISIFLLLFGKIIITTLFGLSYSNAYIPLVILLPGIVFMSLNYILYNYFSAIGEPQVSSIITIISVVINIALNIFLIPIYKSSGAAVASLISYTLSSIITMIIFNRKLKLSFKETIARILSLSDFIEDARYGIKLIKNRISSKGSF